MFHFFKFNFLKFFKKPVFGLDISDHSADVVVLKRVNGGIFLSQYGHVKLEKGVVDNGRVLEAEKLTKALSYILKNAQPSSIATKRLVFSLPASRVFTHFFEIKKDLTNKVVDNLVVQEASEDIPVDLNNCYYDYKVLGEDNKVWRVFFVACPKEIVDPYLKIFSKLSLKPVAIDLENFSVSRVLIPEGLSKEPLVLLDIGARTTTVTVFKDQNLVFTSSIPLAGNRLNGALMKEMNITEEEAKELKKNIGLRVDGKGSNQIELILEKALQEIITELKKIIEYCENYYGYKISRVIMCGGSSKIPNIDKYFSEQLGLTVEIGKYQISAPKNLEIDPILLADAIGSALRGLDEDLTKTGINLLS